MEKRKLAQKEAVEAEIKREMNAEEPQQNEEIEVIERKPKTIPEFLVFFQVYEIATKKEITTFENYKETDAKPSEVKKEYKMHVKMVLMSKFEKEKMLPLTSDLEGFGWVFLVTKKNWIIFLCHTTRAKNSELKAFLEQINEFLINLDGVMTEVEIKKNLKTILTRHFSQLAGEDNTYNKINRANDKLGIATEKIGKTLEGVNLNLVNMEVAENVAKEAYAQAKEMNDQADELANLMADRNKGMTIILIVVACLMAVAVFGNLYATINAPPPPAYPYPPPSRLKDVDNGYDKVGQKELDLVNKTKGKSSRQLYLEGYKPKTSRYKQFKSTSQRQSQ